MKADRTGLDPTDAAELRRLLPGVTDADLPFHQQDRIKDHLMRETTRAERSAAAARPRPRRRLTLVLAAGVATCAVVAAVAFTGQDSGGSPAVAKPEPAAVQLLDRVALAAQSSPLPTVRDGQFLYTRTKGFSTALSETTGGSMKPERTDESAEHWVSVDGSSGTVTRSAKGTTTDPAPGGAKSTVNGPTYRFLESLPTDPDKLLAKIYEDARLNHGEGTDSTTGPDQQAFVAIGDLLRTVEAPPGVSSALYRAAARIPGVVYVPDATDAAGRAGVAVARVHDGERTEWIFDKTSFRLLGERTVVLKKSAWGEAGTPVTSVAIVGRGITDKTGQQPKG
ncbi:CU044_5270 family protein [Streptomyces sp. NPDC048603]|uniref:CU044_5270 family protein n=1 Tax=Streptomyces sp. NPDC048603 TaxID=3365577 RepID=UPI00372084B8